MITYVYAHIRPIHIHTHLPPLTLNIYFHTSTLLYAICMFTYNYIHIRPTYAKILLRLNIYTYIILQRPYTDISLHTSVPIYL